MYHWQPSVSLPVKKIGTVTLWIVFLVLLNGCTTKAAKEPNGSTLINQVEVSAWIMTAGQPSEAQLARMEKSDFELVVNLSPLNMAESLPDEERIIGGKGIDYAHIPVDVRAYDLGQFEMFSDLLNQYRGRKVLVHCQVNMRASVFTFMYQVVHEEIDPDTAYQHVAVIWVPGKQWFDFIGQVFAKYRIDFQHY